MLKDLGTAIRKMDRAKLKKITICVLDGRELRIKQEIEGTEFHMVIDEIMAGMFGLKGRYMATFRVAGDHDPYSVAEVFDETGIIFNLKKVLNKVTGYGGE